ncbi:MAG: hypothetical protein JXA66_01035 [Oligoflexia bacterium]|nr:hypothetical protein [Oligoflexia bacterium]
MKTIIHEKILIAALFVAVASCSTFGNITMTYDTSQERVWQAINVTIEGMYGGIESTKSDPPTVISLIKLKDKEFGLDKRSSQAIVTLTGFKRPFVVDIEVRIYAEGKASEEYEVDRDTATLIHTRVREYIIDQEDNFSFKEDFAPY